MKKITYDQALAELEELSNQLQNGEIGLDLLSEKIKRAGELLNYCKTKLRTAEEDLEKVISQVQ